MKSFRRLALNTVTFGIVTLALLLPALAQQEMDPTWYDPWAKPAAHVTKVEATDAAKPRKVKVASQDRPKNKKVAERNLTAPEGTERAELIRK